MSYRAALRRFLSIRFSFCALPPLSHSLPLASFPDPATCPLSYRIAPSSYHAPLSPKLRICTWGRQCYPSAKRSKLLDFMLSLLSSHPLLQQAHPPVSPWSFSTLSSEMWLAGQECPYSFRNLPSRWPVLLGSCCGWSSATVRSQLDNYRVLPCISVSTWRVLYLD